MCLFNFSFLKTFSWRQSPSASRNVFRQPSCHLQQTDRFNLVKSHHRKRKLNPTKWVFKKVAYFTAPNDDSLSAETRNPIFRNCCENQTPLSSYFICSDHVLWIIIEHLIKYQRLMPRMDRMLSIISYISRQYCKTSHHSIPLHSTNRMRRNSPRAKNFDSGNKYRISDKAHRYYQLRAF